MHRKGIIKYKKTKNNLELDLNTPCGLGMHWVSIHTAVLINLACIFIERKDYFTEWIFSKKIVQLIFK